MDSKSGLDADSQFCYGEERADFYRLRVEYFTRFSPQSPEERFKVDTLIRNEWSLRRLFRAEAHLWEFNTTHSSRRDGAPLGEGFNNSSQVFMRLHRRIALFEKSYEASLTKLKELQEARIASGEVPARATEEELTYPGHTVHIFDDPGQPPEIISVPEDTETVGQALSPGPNPCRRHGGRTVLGKNSRSQPVSPRVGERHRLRQVHHRCHRHRGAERLLGHRRTVFRHVGQHHRPHERRGHRRPSRSRRTPVRLVQLRPPSPRKPRGPPRSARPGPARRPRAWPRSRPARARSSARTRPPGQIPAATRTPAASAAPGTCGTPRRTRRRAQI